MDTHSVDYWMVLDDFIAAPHHTTIFEMSSDLSQVSSSSASPVSSTYDRLSAPLSQGYCPQIVDEQVRFGSYPMPMTPPDFGSDHDSPYCSPHPPSQGHCATEPVFAPVHSPGHPGRTHTTSGRRRAQNRAAQRAFRERKEKHARNLESQLSVVTDNYNRLEMSHAELSASYEKLRRTIELLTQSNDAEPESEFDKNAHRRSSSSETLRKILEILHGEIRVDGPVKTENVED